MTVADTIQDNKNIVQNTSGVIASIGFSELGNNVAGNIVTPATWALNHAVDGSVPSSVDIGIYATGFISTPASAIVGSFKAIIDDDLNKKLNAVRKKEASRYRAFIETCSNKGFAPPMLIAMNIASKGGTAWQATSGIWCYIKDARGKLVSDFTPNSYLKIYRPKHPLQASANGGYKWEVIYP